MANTLVPQPQVTPTPDATQAPGQATPQAAPVSNDQAASTAAAERRKRAAVAVPPPWKSALGTLLPPEAFTSSSPVALQVPPLAEFRRAAFKLAVTGVKGATETQQYLIAADANFLFTNALSDVVREATTDKDAFTQLRLTVERVVAGGDLDRASLDVLRLLALATDDGKTYLKLDDPHEKAPIAGPLAAFSAQQRPAPTDAAGIARRTTLDGLVHAIRDPHRAADSTVTTPAAGPAPMTPAQTQATEALLGRIKTMFPPGGGLAPTAGAKAVGAQRATPQQMDALTGAINGAEPRVRDAVYAWRDSNDKGVLQLLGSYLSPSQVEQAIGGLDPVERVYKQLQERRNGMGDPGTAPLGSEYQIFHDFLAAHLGDEPIRQRTLQHAPLIQQFYQPMEVPQQRVIMRMIISGREQPDAVDRLHEAADAGDSAAAVSAIIELGSAPAKLQTLRADLVFTHRLQDKCNARISYQGVQLKPYDLFLRMCGVDSSNTQEAGALVKQGEVNPSPVPEPPLTPAERGQLDNYLYEPFKMTLVNELNSSMWVRDSTVMTALFEFQKRYSQPDMVALLRRAHEAPGPYMAALMQGAGCDVRLKLQRGLDGDNLIQAERILGFVTDQAAVGVIGGKGALASDYKGENGKGVVPLPQALREMQINGTALSQLIRDKADEMNTALGKWVHKADKVKTVWRDYRAIVTDAVCNDLRVRTGMPRVWPIELLSNAFVQIGGNTLQGALSYEFSGKDTDGVLSEMGMRASDMDSRTQLAATDFKQQQDAAANAAAEQAAHAQVEAARQAEAFRSPSSALFSALAKITPGYGDAQLRAIGAQLGAGLHMAAIAAPPQTATPVQVGPAAAPLAEHDPGARPGGPVHPGEGQPLDFKSFYKREHGIDPTRHAVEVAKAMGTVERPAAKLGELLGVQAADLTTAPPPAPATDSFEITEANRTLVGPDFTLAEAERRANEIWDRLHGNGQIQFIRVLIDGRTQEEQRLIHVAFRKKSGGIDLQFYIEQHLEQQNAGEMDFAVRAGAEGADGKDKRTLDIHGTGPETELMLEASKKGRVSIESRLVADVKANNMDDCYACIEAASPDERRAVLANSAVMGQLRAFGDDSYEWNRIYKGLSGESDMFDRLESRAHGAHGFLGAFQGTDEKGMSSDIKAYAKQRRAAITHEVCGDQPATAAQKKVIQEKLAVEFQALGENPSIRAILQDELSGVEKSDREGLLRNAGEQDNSASALTEHDWTEDEERIIADIKKMSPEERARRRNDPEYINQLHKAIQSETTWRDAMMALSSTEDGTKGENEDNYGALERASRSYRQDSTQILSHKDDLITSLSKLSQSEYARLQADPRLQAQILTALEGDNDKLAVARRMMAYDKKAAAAETQLTVGEHADPAKGVYTQDQVDRVAFLKFSAINQINTGASFSWALLLKASTAVYSMKLKPTEGEKAETPEGGGAAPQAAAPQKEAPTATPQQAATATPQQAATATPQQAATTQAQPQAKAPDPLAADAAADQKIREQIWAAVQPVIADRTSKWGQQDHSDAATHKKVKIDAAAQQKIIEQAIRHQHDPSDDLLAASIGWDAGNWSTDKDRIKETLRGASDDQLINEWTTVMNQSPNGTPSMKSVFDKWVAARAAAGGPLGTEKAPRNPRVGSPEWEARTDLKAFRVDTSRVFEEQLLAAAGGFFRDDHATGDNETAVRDNKEWLEWRGIIRERIPGIDGAKIAGALGAKDDEAKAIAGDGRLRTALGQLQYDTERYQVSRGANSNFNMDRLTAGGQGQSEDNAFVDYNRTVLESTTSTGADKGNQYGEITADEQGRITDARERFNKSDSDFREAKAAVANIAATVAALVITAVVTVLTAGTATGPMAVILLGALTAGAASTGANASKKAIQGTDFEFGNEGIKSIARDTVMGAVTAGTTFYAGQLTSGLFGATSAAQQAALVGSVAKNPSFMAGLGKTMVEQTVQNGMQGMFESGMAAFDPSLWLDGWSEGWRRGSAAARDRASEIPNEMMHAAILAALTHTVSTGAGKLYDRSSGGAKMPEVPETLQEHEEVALEQRMVRQEQAAGNEQVQHAELGTRMAFSDRARLVGNSMVHGVGDGLIAGGAEVVLDEKTYRAEGLKLENIAGKLGSNALDMMKNAATNVHASDAQAVMRFRAGSRELALNGATLNPTEQRLYADLAMRGEGTTVLSVAEFRSVRGEMVQSGAARYEAATGKELSKDQRAAFDQYCRQATSFEDFKTRAEGGPDKAPGAHLAAAPVASFDTPVQREAELHKADQLIASMEPVIESSAGRREQFAAMWPQRQALVSEAMAALASVKPGSPQHAAAADVMSRVQQASSELGHAIETAATGTSSIGLQRSALQLRLEVARANKADPKAYAALHEALLTASAQVATSPKAIEAAGPAAQGKLVELQALAAEARGVQDSAARSVGIGETPVADAPVAAPVVAAAPVAVTPTVTPVAVTLKLPGAGEPVVADPAKVARQDEPGAETKPVKDEPAKVEAKPKPNQDEPVAETKPVQDEPTKEDPKKAEAKPEAVAAKPLDAAVLGTAFAGNTHAADPVRTKAAVDAALTSELPPGATVHGDTVLLARGDRELMFVRVEVATEELSPLAPTAVTRIDGRDNATIRVSAGASPEQVQRAVAGKLAEIAHIVAERAAGKRADTTSALVEGSQSTQLSPQDYSSIAQVKTALHQLEAAQKKGDTTGAEQIRRDAYSMVVGMGLVEAAPASPIHAGPGGKASTPDAVRVTGPEASQRRLELIDKVLGADGAKLRELVSGARADAPAIADIRTQRAAARERLRGKCEELIKQREAANAALKPAIDAALGPDGTGAVFERIIVGGGWAATADFATMKHGEGAGGVPPVLSLSHGGDPWAGRGDLLMGQNAAELEVAGFSVQPGDLATDPHDFTKSGDFSTAVGASAAVAGMPTYDATVSKVEPRPETDAQGWPEGARYRITANGRSFYAKSVDVVSGPGPARVPGAGRRIADPSGYSVDAHTGEYFHHRPGLKDEYVKVDAKDVPADARTRLEAERGTVSSSFVDQESGFRVDASTTPEKVFDKEGKEVASTAVPEDIARRLGIHGGRQKGDGPALVDAQGRPQSTRVFDPESKMSVDAMTKQVFGPDGKLVDPTSLPAETRTRLGFTAEGQFRDPRFVAGPGERSVNPVTGAVIDTKTGAPIDITTLKPEEQAELRALMETHRVKFGGTLLASDYATGADGKVPNVLIYGAGASGAWDLEQAVQGGANADWAGRMRLPKPEQFPNDPVKAEAFRKLNDESTPVEERRALMVQYRDVITQETLKDGHNRRNSVPGLGAYAPDVQASGHVEQSARTIIDIQQTTDGRFYCQFSDGTEGVYDKAIMSIGQDATGEGGVGSLTKGMRLNGLRGTSGELAGAQDESGGLRVLGAAGMGATINRLTEEDQIDAQKQAALLPADSRNIGVSIRNNGGRIAAMNENGIDGETPAETAKRTELEKANEPDTAARLFQEWKVRQASPENVESRQGPDEAVARTDAWQAQSVETFSAAKLMQEKLIAKLGNSDADARAFAVRLANKAGLTMSAARTMVDDFRTSPFERAIEDVAAMADAMRQHAEDPKNERHRVTIPAPSDRFASVSITDAVQQMATIDAALKGFDTGKAVATAPMTPVAAPAAPPPPG